MDQPLPLHFQEFGTGQSVVLLHGLFGSADNWRPIANRLAESYHVLVVDQRNHGASPHDTAMDYPRMAADVHALLLHRGILRARVIGHSMGGKTAMQLALQFPEVVEQLIVADMAPRAYAPVHEPILAALLALDLSQYQTRSQLEDALAPAIPDLFLRRFLLKNMGRDAVGGFAWKMNVRGLADNYPHLCAALVPAAPYAGPTLFLRGGRSDYVRAQDEPEIRARFPAAEIQTIAAAAHWIHADEPEEFLRRVLGFLR